MGRYASIHTLPRKKCSMCSKSSKAAPDAGDARNTLAKKSVPDLFQRNTFSPAEGLNGTDGTDPEQIFLEECSMLISLLRRHEVLLNRWNTILRLSLPWEEHTGEPE